MSDERITSLPVLSDLDGSEWLVVDDGSATYRSSSDTYQQTHMEDARKHGAVLDRTTNDVAAIQAAIDSFNGERGTVWIDGQALCDGNLDAKRCTLAGKGPPGVSGGGGSLIEFTSANGISSSVEDGYGYSIDGLQIVGSNGGTPTASGQVLVDFTGQSYPRLRRCRIRDGEVGVRLQDGTSIECHYGRFFGVDIDRCLTGWDTGNGTPAHDHHVYGGRVWSCTTGMLIDSGVNSVKLYGVTFEATGSIAVDSTGDEVSLLGCYFENSGATNLRIRSGAGEHYHFGVTWSSGTDIVDDNTPGVVNRQFRPNLPIALPPRLWGETDATVTHGTYDPPTSPAALIRQALKIQAGTGDHAAAIEVEIPNDVPSWKLAVHWVNPTTNTGDVVMSAFVSDPTTQVQGDDFANEDRVTILSVTTTDPGQHIRQVTEGTAQTVTGVRNISFWVTSGSTLGADIAVLGIYVVEA